MLRFIVRTLVLGVGEIDAMLMSGQIRSNHIYPVWCLRWLTRRRTRTWRSSPSATSPTRRARSNASLGSTCPSRCPVEGSVVLLPCPSGDPQHSGRLLASTTLSPSPAQAQTSTPPRSDYLRTICSRSRSSHPDGRSQSRWRYPRLPSHPSSTT